MIKLIVDSKQRYAKMRAHTATHLLHMELGLIFPTTKQAGSLVDDDYTRFDFTADRALSPKEIETIEHHINDIIGEGLAVETQEMKYDEATKSGAKAFFEEKYGDVVRVVSIGGENTISTELCGGTHVSNTRDIGAFKIVSQEAVASGVKRIVAVTGPNVARYAQQYHEKLTNYANLFGVSVAQLDKKLTKIIKDNEELKNKIESLQTKVISSQLQSLSGKHQEPFHHVIDIPESLLSVGFKNIVHEAKNLFLHKNILLRTPNGQYAIVGGPSFHAKDRATKQGIKGGGSDTIFQGKDEKILNIT